MQVVWLKRDLRLNDHQPLCEAIQTGEKVVVMYVLEPEYSKQPDTSSLHLWWISTSVSMLRDAVKKLGGTFSYFCCSITEALEKLLTIEHFTLHSHQETGNWWSYQRDILVQKWCASKNIFWKEYQQFGVFRKLHDRNGWSTQRDLLFSKSIFETPQNLSSVIAPYSDDIKIIPRDTNGLLNTLIPGELAATKMLDSFLSFRSKHYLKNIAHPFGSQEYSSRLSPYISFGNISLKKIAKETKDKMNALSQSKQSPFHVKSLEAFQSRLYWHCHFIQKLETQPSIECEDSIPLFKDMRTPYHNDSFLSAWKAGTTGYPFIDACMRALYATGWLSFRMRAMLVSFATYDLLLDWRCIAHHLAQLFIDYEPGIHYSQLQMQSGTTGINATRMYDPIKQGYEFDPKGIFVKKWVPELAQVPSIYIHEPWRMTLNEQKQYACIIGSDYPERLVEHKAAIKKARSLISTYRNKPEFTLQKNALYQKLGSRFKQRKKMIKQNRQLGLFDD